MKKIGRPWVTGMLIPATAAINYNFQLESEVKTYLPSKLSCFFTDKVRKILLFGRNANVWNL